MPPNPLSKLGPYPNATVEDQAEAILANATDNGSDYGDFGDDAEELEIVDKLLSQVASKPEEHESLIVTDIEDYEPPRGIRLPKVLGLEQTRLSQDPAQSASQLEILRDFETTGGEHQTA
jgi:hypothetical protein